MLWSEPQGGKRFTRSQDEEIVDTPHPEEAAKQLSRRMHCANPADLQFFHMLLRRNDDEADRSPAQRAHDLLIGKRLLRSAAEQDLATIDDV